MYDAMRYHKTTVVIQWILTNPYSSFQKSVQIIEFV